MIKNPYYIAEITSSRCSIEFSVNGVPNYNHFEESNTASTATIEWPINLFIIQNGMQHFELKVMPLKNETFIIEKAFVKIKIFKAEAIIEYVPQELISEEIEITFMDKKKLPFFLFKNSFQAELPFKVDGWQNSLDLSKENKDSLYKEIITWNEKILNIYKTANNEEYIRVFKIRDSEVSKLMYFPENSGGDFHPKFKDLISLPNNLYILELYADGKLASVRMPFELPGFRYDPKIINDEAMGFSLNVYFYRREKGLPLEIIR